MTTWRSASDMANDDESYQINIAINMKGGFSVISDGKTEIIVATEVLKHKTINVIVTEFLKDKQKVS
jgi:hypothetical protein